MKLPPLPDYIRSHDLASEMQDYGTACAKAALEEAAQVADQNNLATWVSRAIRAMIKELP